MGVFFTVVSFGGTGKREGSLTKGDGPWSTIDNGTRPYFLSILQMPVRCHGYSNFISQFTYIIHNLL
jgi:hypothetical protein